MKICSLLFLGFAGAMGSSVVNGFDTHELLQNHITQLKTETEVLAASNFAKDTEISSLHAKLDELNAACDGDDSDWTPTVGESWNYNLQAPVKTNIDVDVFVIDTDTAQAKIDTLHKKGKTVVCSISIGTVEDWRDDADDFPADAIGINVGNFESEKWLDINNQVVKDIMAARVLKAASLNCDGIDPDNMMMHKVIEYGGNTGFPITREEQIAYNIWFAETVHASGMKVGLKNGIDMIEDVLDYFDFAVNEECIFTGDCEKYELFINQGKPVFSVEYSDKWDDMDMCDVGNTLGMDTIVKKPSLKGPLCSCADSSRDWKCNKVL